MGKQYNKLIKRKRRVAYLARLKSKQSLEKPVTEKKAKKTLPKKTPIKKAEPKTNPSSTKTEVAGKASAVDVLGPESQEKKASESTSTVEKPGS